MSSSSAGSRGKRKAPAESGDAMAKKAKLLPSKGKGKAAAENSLESLDNWSEYFVNVSSLYEVASQLVGHLKASVFYS